MHHDDEATLALYASHVDELFRERSRAMGLPEDEIAEIERESETDVAKQIRSEVEIGLQLFRRALLGDSVAIEKLRKGSLEFAVAIVEGAITADDLRTLPASVHSAMEAGLRGVKKH
jgi:hypothetical protein